jgi:hypothetical protein
VDSCAAEDKRRLLRLRKARIKARRPCTVWRRDAVVVPWLVEASPRVFIVGFVERFLSAFRSVASSLTATGWWANRRIVAARFSSVPPLRSHVPTDGA